MTRLLRAMAGLLLAATASGQGLPLLIRIADVGQGSGAILRTPDGRVHVIDAGNDGDGTAVMLPQIAALAPSGYGYAFASHFHSDHIGGLDEVLARPFVAAVDRGDVARASNADITRYLQAAGTRRAIAQPGMLFALGGGVTVSVVAVDGRIRGGGSVPVTGKTQEENARSLVLRLDYGDFSMWFGGDLTGGGSGTPDVESPAATACGDVDVYLVNHHGSSTSTANNLVARLRPELALVSCGSANPYGHPTAQTINRLNQAAAARMLLATTQGTGIVGFGVTGNATLVVDRDRYRVTAQNGETVELFVDETTAVPAPGVLRVTELHRDPQASQDAYGEYVELLNLGPHPISLAGARVSTTSGTFTVHSSVALLPGRPLVLLPDGDPARNGGLPLGFVWPYQALALGDTNDTLRLQHGSTLLEQVSWSSGFPGGVGVAAERRDLVAPASASNFAPAVATYGGSGGDRGSPARRNSAEQGDVPAALGLEIDAARLRLHATALRHGGRFGVVALAFGDQPGFLLGTTPVPLNPDALFLLSLGLPGAAVLLPPEGWRVLDVPLPSPNPLTGTYAYAAHLVLDFGPPFSVPSVSAAVRFRFP